MKKAIHDWGKLLLSPITVPVRQGPQKGTRWILSTSSHFWRGTFELENAASMQRWIRPGEVAYDIGAHVGYFSVYMSRLVGSQGTVYAFEPRGINLRFLRRHLRINGCPNVVITEACVGDRSGAAKMETRQGGTGTAFVSDTGDLDVTMVCIDELVGGGQLPAPDYMKIDVEGAETKVLRGARRTLCEHRPRLIVATHSPELMDQCSQLLRDCGYDLDVLVDREIVAVPQKCA